MTPNSGVQSGLQPARPGAGDVGLEEVPAADVGGHHGADGGLRAGPGSRRGSPGRGRGREAVGAQTLQAWAGAGARFGFVVAAATAQTRFQVMVEAGELVVDAAGQVRLAGAVVRHSQLLGRAPLVAGQARRAALEWRVVRDGGRAQAPAWRRARRPGWRRCAPGSSRGRTSGRAPSRRRSARGRRAHRRTRRARPGGRARPLAPGRGRWSPRVGPFGRGDGVFQEHGHGHGADALWAPAL